jgi:hypothetical protein
MGGEGVKRQAEARGLMSMQSRLRTSPVPLPSKNQRTTKRTAQGQAAHPVELAAELHDRASAAGAAAGDELAGQPPPAAAARGLALLDVN